MRSRALNDLRLARLRLTRPIPENFPAMLLEAIAACAQIVEDRARFPELGGGRGQERFKFTHSDRERDLRRLEACALVLMAILFHTDLVRMRSGRPRRDGSCDGVPNRRRRPLKGRRPDPKWRDPETLEELTGVSGGRVTEAIRDLRSAGYLESHQPVSRWEDDAGDIRYRGMAAVHTVTGLAWKRLGISGERLSVEKALASRREHEKPAPIVDIFAQRQRQRIVRAQARAARRVAASIHPSEAEGRKKIRELEERLKRERQE